MTVTTITSAEQFEETLRKNRKVAVDFTDTWSGPCRLISVVFNQLAGQFQGILFVSVDVNKLMPIAFKYSTGAIPSCILFKNGEKCGEVVGANVLGLQRQITEFAG